MFFTITSGECCPDWLIECQNFLCGDALQDAVLTSLFTDARDPACGDGGYWGDPTRGSLLYKVVPGARVNQTLADIETSARDALIWLERDGIVSGLSVDAEFVDRYSANLRVSFEKPSGCDITISGASGEYGWVWNYGISK